MIDLKSILEKVKQRNLIDHSKRRINQKVILIDGLNNFIIQYAGNPIRNQTGYPIGGIVGFLTSLQNLVKNFFPTRIIIYFDGKNASKKRKQMFSQYKQNRSSLSKGIHYKYLSQYTIQECVENMSNQLARLTQYLDCLPITIKSFQGVQADDCIAYTVNKLKQSSSEVIIVSTDKDYFQLIDQKVTVYNPIKKINYTIDKIKQQFNLHPYNFILYKSTIGDKSDNINGVKGIQIKTFNKILNEWNLNQNFFNIDQYIQKLQTLEQGKSKKILQLKQSSNIIKRNYQLMQLKDSIINHKIQFVLHQIITEPQKININKVQIIKYYIQDRFQCGINNIEDFIRNFLKLQYYLLNNQV